MIWRRLLSWRVLVLTHVPTRAPTAFLHSSLGIPMPLSEPWTSMRDSLTNDRIRPRNFFSSKQPTLDSMKLVLILLCPLPLHLKLGLVGLLLVLLFDCFSSIEGLLAAELGILRKEYHGGRSKDASVHAYYPILTSSSCMCSIWSWSRSPLTAEPLSQAAYHLSSRE